MRWHGPARIIAVDGTARKRGGVEALLARIHHHHLLAMADCSSVDDGLACVTVGRGHYRRLCPATPPPIRRRNPILPLVKALHDAGCRR